MSSDDINQNFDDEQLDQEMIEETQDENDEVKKAVPAWIISIVLHVLVLGLLSLIVYAAREEAEEPPIKTTSLPVPPKQEEKKLDRDVKPTEMPLDVEVESEKPSPVSELDVPVEEFSREEENDANVPKGREEAKADSEMGGEGAFMAIGAGGGSSGMFGSRNGGGKKRALGKFGGSRGSESAVDAALRWFKKHQSPNGQWDVDGYPVNCTETPKCEPGTQNTDESGDIAATGYALLCFLGAGYDHRMPSKYKATVKKGLDWLISVQKPTGAFGARNYELGIATMAVCEAYAMSNDPMLKEPAQKGVDLILGRQLQEKGGGYALGWDYVEPKATRIDASVSGWCVMALKSAAAGGLTIGNGMEGAKQYLERAWKVTNPDFKAQDPYKDETTFPYTWNTESNEIKIERGSDVHHDMAPVGALMAVFLGHKADDPMLNSLANYIMNHQFPTAYPCNTYFMYYNTLAIFQVGGERWEKWNKVCRDMLVNAQRKGQGCFDGSWDWEGTKFPHHEAGRIFSTAYCCLSLEVYYRYLPVGQVKH
jgi:hypothetical protein